jgi:thiol-disulfide isomerase/thioredoxin
VICQLSTKGGCNSILSSPAANVFSWLTWSEVGFFYFSGTLLVMLFAGNSVKTVSVLFLFNIICLPYTVYSVCYQAFIARQWCVLCCSVQASLWLEFACLARYVSINGFQLSSFTVNEAGTLICCLAGPVFSWIVMKPYFIKLQLQPSLQRQLNKLKYDVISFGNLLKTQPQYPVPNKNWSILLGSEDAASVITVVINPYCTPCAKTHVALTELLEKNKNLQARIIFRDPNSEDDRRTIISRHLMALNEAGDKALMERALNDWFAQKTKKYEKWAQKYPVNLIEDNFSKLDIQNAWCKQAKIGSTPAVLLNGYHLPEIYQLKDLKYMIEDTEDTLQG